MIWHFDLTKVAVRMGSGMSGMTFEGGSVLHEEY
jgi:hypothetical protein